MLFETRNLSFSYDGKKVLDGIFLEIAAERVVGILGPNGSGKSTLVDLLVRNRRPDTGTVHFEGKPIGSYSRKELARHIALVPQDFYINFPFTVAEVVMMGRYPYIARFGRPSADDVDIVHEVMRRTDIDRFANRLVTELSGGERQRVVFARALAQNTPVIILDEATSNLDIRFTMALLDEVRDRSRRNRVTVIGVFQDINLAALYCDELVFLKQGTIVAHGDTDRILTADTIETVFHVNSEVLFNSFINARQVVFKSVST
jgi:iron complex transport system ATP-binding protein